MIIIESRRGGIHELRRKRSLRPLDREGHLCSRNLQGLLTWVCALGERRRGDPTDGSTYGSHVLTALEAILIGKGLLSPSALAERRAAWEEDHRRTPHGMPVTLPAPEP